MIYLANDKFNTTLSAGYTVGQNTLSVANVPDNVPTIIVAGYGTDNETVFTITGKTTNSLTGVARLRGANIDLDAQTPITCVNNAEFLNQYATTVSTPETLKPLYYAEDGGSTDAYAVALDPAIVAYVTGLMVVFKANTANTGAATLNVNGKGAKTIKKNKDQDLASGDIQSGHVIVVIYDGTNFQLQSPGANSGDKIVTLTDGATPALDASLGTIFRLDAEGNRTIGIPTNPTDGKKIVIEHTATGGARTLALNSGTGGFAFGTDITGLTETASGKTDEIGCIYNATANKWRVVGYAKGY